MLLCLPLSSTWSSHRLYLPGHTQERHTQARGTYDREHRNHNGATSEISMASLNYLVFDLHHWTAMYVGRGMQHDATHITAFEDHKNITCSYQWMLSLTTRWGHRCVWTWDVTLCIWKQWDIDEPVDLEVPSRYPVRETSGLSRLFVVISPFCFLCASVYIPVIDNETASAFFGAVVLNRLSWNGIQSAEIQQVFCCFHTQSQHYTSWCILWQSFDNHLIST